jgi:hypothetical protein
MRSTGARSAVLIHPVLVIGIVDVATRIGVWVGSAGIGAGSGGTRVSRIRGRRARTTLGARTAAASSRTSSARASTRSSSCATAATAPASSALRKHGRAQQQRRYEREGKQSFAVYCSKHLFKKASPRELFRANAGIRSEEHQSRVA